MKYKYIYIKYKKKEKKLKNKRHNLRYKKESNHSPMPKQTTTNWQSTKKNRMQLWRRRFLNHKKKFNYKVTKGHKDQVTHTDNCYILCNIGNTEFITPGNYIVCGCMCYRSQYFDSFQVGFRYEGSKIFHFLPFRAVLLFFYIFIYLIFINFRI